ncbi:MAG: HAD-IA family hydrolase, partial [Bacteroidales bacterium]
KLSNSGLNDYFDKVILSDQIGYNKPHPKIFDFALKSTNSRKKESVMIGDNFDTDITGAKNSNIDQIFFKNIGEYDIKFDPTYTVCELQEIQHIL